MLISIPAQRRLRRFFPWFLAILMLCISLISLLRDPVCDFSARGISGYQENLARLLERRTAEVAIVWYHSPALDKGAFASRPIWRDLRCLAADGSLPVRVVRHDPGNNPALLSELGRLGARSLSHQGGESVGLYSTVLVEYGEEQRLIPWVDSRDALAVELAQVFDSLLNARQDLVSLIAPPLMRPDIERILSANGRAVRVLEAGQAVPDASDALLVFGALNEIPNGSVDSIQDWLDRGGSCLFALDRIRVDLNAGSAVRDSVLLENSALEALLARLGLAIEGLLVHDERSLEIASVQTNSLGEHSNMLQSYPWWPSTPASADIKPGPLLFKHPGLDLFWSSPLRQTDRPGWTAAVLLSSSSRTRLPSLPWYLHPAELSFNETGNYAGAQNLAFCLEQGDGGARVPGSKPARVILIGDSQFLGALAARPDGRSPRNEIFFLDALDWLEGRDALGGLRVPYYRFYTLEEALPLPAWSRLLLFVPLLFSLVFPALRFFHSRLRSSR